MKKRIITVLIAILTVIPLVLITPKANTTQTSTHTVTSYGDYTFQQGTSDSTFNYELPGLPINITYASGSWMKLDYQFKDKYSGTMKFTVTSSADWVLNSANVYWGVSAEGAESTCYISATTTMNSVSRTKTFSIIFQNATAIHFSVAAPNNVNFFNSSQSITISNASFTSQPDMHDIYSEIDHIGSQFDFYIPGMSTNLTNIATNTSTMAADIATIKTYLDGLEGYTDQIEPYLNQLININKIQSFELWQHNILFWANSYENVNFDSSMPYINYLSSYHDSDYDSIHRFCVGPNSTQSLYFYSSTSINISNIYLYYRGSDPEVSITRTYSVLPPMNMFMYRLDFTNSTNSLSYFEMEFDKTFILYPIFWGDINSIPDEVHYLFGEELNNTYTRLLQQISNGIGGSSYDTSQYEQYEQSIDNLNDNMRDRFNNSETSFQNNLNDIFVPENEQVGGDSNTIFQQFHFNAINNLFSGFLGDIFEIAPALKYIMLFGLLLLVLGVLI